MKTIREMLKDCKCLACIWSDILDEADWDGEIICRAKVRKFPEATDYTHDHEDWCEEGQWLCRVSSTTPHAEGVVESDVLTADQIVWSYATYKGPREIEIVPKHTELHNGHPRCEQRGVEGSALSKAFLYYKRWQKELS